MSSILLGTLGYPSFSSTSSTPITSPLAIKSKVLPLSKSVHSSHPLIEPIVQKQPTPDGLFLSLKTMSELANSKEKVIRSITQHQKRLSKLEIQTICKRYQNGASIYKLAADFGCHRRTISDTLKRNGIEVFHKATTKPELVKRVIELYTEMKTPKEVRAIVGGSAKILSAKFSRRMESISGRVGNIRRDKMV